MEYRLEHSLHNHIYIPLDKQQADDEVDSPWAVYVKSGQQKPRELRKDTSIEQIFEETIGHRLLILGAPGSGKTTTLLKLAKTLVERAEQDNTKGIPVLLNLSSWKKDDQSIADWIIDNLKFKYGIRPDIGKKWLEEKTILPLLDGLDELKAARQDLCIQKVNEFLSDFWQVGEVVVCSRTEEYELQQSRFVLNGSIILEPLTPEKIERFLIQTENQPLWATLQHDKKLFDLAKTPLLLDLMVIACQEISFEAWEKVPDTETKISLLLDAYIQQRLGKKIKRNQRKDNRLTKQFSNDKTFHWLGWLAWQLTQHKETEFFIEYLQPSYLSKLQKRSVEFSYLVISIIFMFIAFVVKQNFVNSLLSIASLLLFLMSLSMASLIQGITTKASLSLVIGFFVGWIEDKWLIGVISSVVSFLLFNSISFLSGNKSYTITPFETFSFSLRKFIKSFSRGAFFSLIATVIMCRFLWHLEEFTIEETNSSWLVIGLVIFVLFFLTFGLISAVTEGIQSAEISIKNESNEGMKRTFRNSFLMIPLVSSVLFFSFALLVAISIHFGLTIPWNITVIWIFIFLESLISFQTSLSPLLDHLMLRALLMIFGYIPLNYASFLDYCTGCLLLQRVGGGYRFIHRYLQEYFAAQYDASL